MHEIIRENISAEEICQYLPSELARLRCRMVDFCTVETYQRMLERGWRRFGSLFFRPSCRSCQECRSLRVEVEGFRPNRSMRRTWRRNRDLRVILQRPALSEERLDLYQRYHDDMTRRRGWPEKDTKGFDYYLTFVHSTQEFGHELLFLLADRLVAVTLTDVLSRGVSAVYSYYEPELRSRSLGVYSVLRHITLARSLGLPHVYLGFLVAGNRSMTYKINYRPHQILEGRPEFNERPVWRRPASSDP